MKTKTTNGRVTSKRDKHVARGARVLTTGISIASVLGLTSAYAVAAQHASAALANDPAAVLPNINQLTAPIVITPVIAPSQPAPATPATALAPVATTPSTLTSKVTRTIKIKAPRQKQTATKSGGSK